MGADEIVVTAQKREQSIQDVPISLSAFGGEELAARGVQSLADIATLLPNVNVGEVAGVTQISARGVGFALLTGAGENAIAAHADGIYLSRPGVAGMLQKDLARVEFLRGPQGTLYGRNATGGAVNFISPAPPTEFEAGASIGFGNYELREASGFIGGPVADSLRARLFVSGSDRAGYVDNVFTGGDVDDLRSIGGRLAIDADLSETVSAKLRVFTRTEDFAGPYYDPIDPNSPAYVFGLLPRSSTAFGAREIAADAPFDSTRRVTGGSAQIDWSLGDVIVRSVTGYTDYTFESAIYDGDGTSLDLFAVSRDETSQTFTQEINLIGEGDRLDWVIGAYYLDESVDLTLFTTTPALTAPPFGSPPFVRDITNPSRDDSTSTSVFADATWKATDRVSLFAGLRQTWDEREFNNPNILDINLGAGFVELSSCALVGFPNGRASRDDEATTGRIGGSYQPSESTHFYAQYARGYKSGGFGVSSCRNAFEPEELDAYEIGSKNRFANGLLTLNAAVFHYAYTNLQVEQVIATSLLVRNAPEATVTGGELELVWAPTDAFSMNLALGLLDATYETFVDVDPLDLTATPQNLSGRRLNRAPEWTINVGGEYVFDLGGRGALTARADVYATDDYALRPYQTSRLDFQNGYTTVNASLAYATPDERWGVRAWIRNATDEDYLVGMLTTLPGREGQWGAPRTFGVEFTARY